MALVDIFLGIHSFLFTRKKNISKPLINSIPLQVP